MADRQLLHSPVFIHTSGPYTPKKASNRYFFYLFITLDYCKWHRGCAKRPRSVCLRLSSPLSLSLSLVNRQLYTPLTMLYIVFGKHPSTHYQMVSTTAVSLSLSHPFFIRRFLSHSHLLSARLAQEKGACVPPGTAPSVSL